MINKEKPCKGNHKAPEYGCGELNFKRTYGLCIKCLRLWSIETKEGLEWLKKQTAYKLKSNEKVKRKETRAIKQDLDSKGAMRLADMYFSRYIRAFYSDQNGNCTCYTCGEILYLKEVDNGHYQKREHKATRYHLNNCRPQCKICNGDTKHNGKQSEFRVHLSYEIGEENVVNIERLARTKVKATSKFYRDIADEYRIKLNELQKQIKRKYW